MTQETFKKWNDMTVDEQFEYIDETYNGYDLMTNKDFYKRGIESGVKKLEAQNKELVEALKFIAKTDIAEKAPDHLWLNKWRNDTKEFASETLKKLGVES